MKRLGFVGIILGEHEIKMKSCILKNASSERLSFLIEYNIRILDEILEYLNDNDIRVFRISSGAIPFASHEANQLNWCKEHCDEMKKLGGKARRYGIRLSMHPGQYSVLNAENPEIVKKAILDLKYHVEYLDCLGLSPDNKVVLHIGGVYGDKEKAMERFIQNYNALPQNLKDRIVLENDDKNYTATDALFISKRTGAPVLFDYFHYTLNHYDKENWLDLLKKCGKTWKGKDGRQKIHYSQSANKRCHGAHSLTIEPKEFFEFYRQVSDDIDIMLEVKDKNLSVLKCKEFLENVNK